MKTIFWGTLMFLLAGCAAERPRQSTTMDRIQSEIKGATQERAKPAQPEAVSQALLPPLVVEMPRAGGRATEHRFDIVVNSAPAPQVFMSIVSGTRFSMIVHPEVTGNLSLNLKDVTVQEALDTIREMYGFEYKVQGTRIFIQPMTLQTRLFQVNYLAGSRTGRSDLRVSSGSVSDSGSGGTAGAATPGAPAAQPGATSGGTSRSLESSRITTSSKSDFWTDLAEALRAIVGQADGRQVIVSAGTGVIVVRGFPQDFRNVQQFLKATRLAVERQVMLEAKIIEVVLKDGFQSGINWAGFYTGANGRLSAGQLTPGTTLQPFGNLTTSTARAPDGSLLANSDLSSGPGLNILTGSAVPATIFGLAFQTKSFATLLSFLESQGGVQVLSSPRVATLNNQKAVLKVGTDEFFLTNITTTQTVTTVGAAAPPSPSITVQPFFSGIALDVTPQIDEHGNIILHIHPSVSTVVEKRKDINLGALGNFTLPLASSDISETDSIVRVQDGNIVAIGGLMKQQSETTRSQLPGLGDLPGVGVLFGQRARNFNKSELVILLKPTVIHGDRDWEQDLGEMQTRLQNFDPRPPASQPQN